MSEMMISWPPTELQNWANSSSTYFPDKDVSQDPSLRLPQITLGFSQPDSSLQPTMEGMRNSSQPSLAELLYGVSSFRTAMTLIIWLFPIMVGVGLIGNMVSLRVLLKPGMRRTSACRYLACLAVADTVVLLSSALKTWVRVRWDFELLHVSSVTCKLFIFLTHTSLMVAAWLIVAVTLERFLAVWLPLRAIEVCSVGRSRLVVPGILALLGLLNSHVFWTAELLPIPPRQSLTSSSLQCASYAHKTLACEVFPWVHLVFYCFLPTVLLLCLNTLILFKLFQHRQAITASQDSRSSRSSSNRHPLLQERPHSPNQDDHASKVCSKAMVLNQRSAGARSPQHLHRRLAPMLLGVSFSWLILTTPQTIYGLASSPPSNIEQLGQRFLIKTICFLLMYLNHASHFFLYCLTGQRFRQELKRSLPCSGSNKDRARCHKLLLPKQWHGHQNGQEEAIKDTREGDTV